MTKAPPNAEGFEALWSYVLAMYQDPEVRRDCLILQDEGGHCVSLLLWAAYEALRGRDVPAQAEAAVALAQMWEAALRPLRQARDQLKQSGEGAQMILTTQVRQQIMSSELAGERAMLTGLAALSGARVDPADEATLLGVFQHLAPMMGADKHHPKLRALSKRLVALFAMH